MFQLIKTSSITIAPHNKSFISWTRLEPLKPYCALFAGFIIQILVGGFLGIGNFLPYIASLLSYLHHTIIITESNNICTPEIHNIYTNYLADCNWILTASVCGYAIIGPVGGQLYIYLQSMRWVVFIGGTIVTIVILLNFYVQQYIILIILLFGFMFGIGCGLYWGSTLAAAIKWWPTRRGFATGVVIFGMGLGQSVFDVIETLYINPTNIPSDGHCGYIFNTDILQRIPSCFFVLSALSAFLTLLATALFFEKPDNVDYIYEPVYVDTDENSATEYDDMKATQAVKTLQFWLIFSVCFFMMMLLCFVYSEWKVFAQDYLEIENDHFLLTLGMFASFMNASGRIFWGFYLDKTQSFAISMGTATFLVTVFLSTMPLCYYVENKEAMVFIWITVLYVAVGATYSIIPPQLSHTFGSKYSAILIGLITWSDIGSAIVNSTIVNATLPNWISLCSIMAAIGAASFIITVSYPSKREKIFLIKTHT